MSEYALTTKGTKVPLLKLKGKDYLQVAYRILWLNEDYSNYQTEIDMLKLTDDYACVKVTLTLQDTEGKIIKKVSDIKTENQKSFPDFVEKAVTGALGRCLAQVGFGTQFALQDLDEGDRLADSPVQPAIKSESKGDQNESDSNLVSKSSNGGFKPKPKTDDRW
jgi:hypothetical protein